MQTLKDAIVQFQKEVSAALDTAPNEVNGVRWLPERVSLSLEVELDLTSAAGTPGMRVVQGAEGAAGGSRISIEFRLATANGEGHGGTVSLAPTSIAERRPAESETDRAVRELSAIFGAPGFDSSARAAVFCDAVGSLSTARALALCQSLTGAVEDIEEDVRRARHLLLGVIRSGPLKTPGRAAEMLADLFQRCAIPTLVRLVEEQWKTQEDWHA